MIAAALFLLTIPAANWLIGNVGTTCAPCGPCLVPVLPGVMAPSGVILIGAALVLRDLVRERLGFRATLGLIAAGAALSLLVASPALALASAVAFAASELADAMAYEPLRQRSRPLAVLASSAAGAVVDSAMFLLIAFGSLEFLAGQVVGKLWAAAAFAAYLWARRR